VAAVGGVTMCPTVGSAAVDGAVAVLGLHCWNQGGQLRLSGVGRGQLRLSGVGRGLASACSVGGGTAAAGAKGVVAITAVALPAWYLAWLAVVSGLARPL